MDPQELLNLKPLTARSSGSAEIAIGVIDGPVHVGHGDLSKATIRFVGVQDAGKSVGPARLHGTSVAGLLVANRASSAPGVCPSCTLLVRSIFRDGIDTRRPTAGARDLAEAIVACVDAGARVLNLSAAMECPSSTNLALTEALNYAARRGALVVAAAGNQSAVASSGITSHPWVIPVAGCDSTGRVLDHSNLGRSVGRNGVRAPAISMSSLSAHGGYRPFGGTSAAAALVTGAIALIWSEFPSVAASELRSAVVDGSRGMGRTIVPPLLNASRAADTLRASMGSR